MDVHVECAPGLEAEPEPRRLQLGGTTLEVAEILDRWLAPGHRYFKLRAGDGGLYIVRHEAATGAWQITFYRDPRSPETPDRWPGRRS